MANMSFTLSQMLRHAFISGAGVTDGPVPSDVLARWVEYEPPITRNQQAILDLLAKQDKEESMTIRKPK